MMIQAGTREMGHGYFFTVTICMIILNFGGQFSVVTGNSLPGSCVRVAKFGGPKNEAVTFNSVVKPQMIPSKLATSYDSKGLDPFFNLAESFCNTVQPDPFPVPPRDNNGNLKLGDITKAGATRDKWIKYETPILVAVGIGILFALLMPVVGCCFCCCRCCGKCGGEMVQSHDNAHNHTKCCICSFILFIIAVFFLCGVLFMYVTNNRMNKEIEGTGNTYINAIDELVNYANNTIDEVNQIVPTQLNCAIDLILADVSIQGLTDGVAKPIQAAIKPKVIKPLDQVRSATQNVSAMSTSLDRVVNTTNDLRSKAAGLGTDLDNVRNELVSILNNCSGVPVASESCAKVDSSGLRQEANFSALPNVDNELKNIRDILNQNFSGKAEEGRKVFDDIPQTVLDKTKNTQKDIDKLAKDAKEKIANITGDLLDKIRDSVVNKKGEFVKYKADYIDKYIGYEKWRWYGGIAMAAWFNLLLVLLAFGLVAGICSYDKDMEATHRKSVSHHGGNCLMAVAGLMFLSAFVLFLLCAVFFFAGEHVHIFCREMKDAKLADQWFGNKIVYNGSQINVGQLIKDCRNNEAIYKAAGADRFINFDDKLNVTKQLGNIDEQLDKLKVNLSDQSILNAETKKSLNDLANSSVDKIDFNKFFDELGKRIVQVDLIGLANNLTTLATNLRATNQSKAEELANRTNAVAVELKRIQNEVVSNISMAVNQLKADVQNLQGKGKDLEQVAKGILSSLEAADTYIKQQAGSDIMKVVKEFTNRVLGWATQFAEQTRIQIKQNLARCKPIANLWDGLFNTYFCKGVVGNVNGFWLSMGWCLFFFVPIIIFSIRLAKYFRRMNYLEGLESETRDNFDSGTYPGYANGGHHDKIPLQNMPPAYHMHGRGEFVPMRARMKQPHGGAPPPYEAHHNNSYQN